MQIYVDREKMYSRAILGGAIGNIGFFTIFWQ